jgi:CheY-like chemotaxis protein
VRRLVQLHGGRIAVHSGGPGAGTEFIVHFPRAPEPARGGAAPESAAERPGRNRRVLVCDDNVDAADSLAGLLSLSGYSVRVAYDGSSARHTAEEFRPQVAVLDLGLPDMSGEEVARWIGQQPWADEVTLIAVTGWGERQDRERTAAAGFRHHLVKPVDPQALLQLIGG